MDKTKIKKSFDEVSKKCKEILEEDGVLFVNEAFDIVMKEVSFLSNQDRSCEKP